MPPKAKSSSSWSLPEKLNANLAKCLVDCACFRVPGAKTGYRNKICYSLVLDSDKPFPTSDQAMPILNEMSTAVNQQCRDLCNKMNSTSTFSDNNDDSPPPENWKDFFVEVTAKMTRKNEVTIKLAVTHDLADKFITSFSSSFASSIIGQFPPSSSSSSSAAVIKCFMLHIAPPGEKKGTKFGASLSNNENEENETSGGNPDQQQQSRYVPIFENRTSLIDLTPNGVPVQISTDSFTEVNPKMEDEMYKAVLEFLDLPPPSSSEVMKSDENPSKKNCASMLNENDDDNNDEHKNEVKVQNEMMNKSNRCALFMGRDCNVQYSTLRYFYKDRVMLTTNCPRALRDATEMDLPNFVCVPKEKVSEMIFDHSFLDADKNFNGNNSNNSDEAKWDFVITAGRHGLVPTISHAINSPHVVRRVANFIYTSCNLDSLTRDLHIFRRNFVIAGVKSFDFFPGTRYTMTMVHFVPRKPKTSLLVLPIGLCGCGKSSCSKSLKEEFEKDPPLQEKDKKLDITKVKRSLHRVNENVTVEIFERDDCFHQIRSVQGKSLSATKSEVHSQLVQFLSQSSTTTNSAAEKPGNVGVDAAFEDSACNNNNNNNNNNTTNNGSIRILDSSNGSIEQRKEYRRIFQEGVSSSSISSPAASTVHPVIEVYFDPTTTNDDNTSSHDLLLERCLARRDHPAFPSSDREEAKRKIEAISKAIEPPSGDDINSFTIRCASGSWKNTFDQFAWICFLSFFTRSDKMSIAKMILADREIGKRFEF